MITKTTRKAPARRSITANTSITAGAMNRHARRSSIQASTFAKLTPQQKAFANQLKSNLHRGQSITAATNTSNIAARPDFMELLPLFVQQLLLTDVFGSVAMRSRQQLIPYFKVVSRSNKGETAKGDIFSTPFANRQGMDPNFTGRVVKNEDVQNSTIQYVPVLPGSVSVVTTTSGATTTIYDDGNGGFVDASGAAVAGATIDYASGLLTGVTGDTVAATYQYDNETIGPKADGTYGAGVPKLGLQLDEINLIAEAHEVACYYSLYAAFAAQQEYGANINDLAKEAAFSELTAEINTNGFEVLANAATYKPQFDFDASPIFGGAVVSSDYLNMFKLKLDQAAAAIYNLTQLSRANRLVVGSNVAAVIGMMNGFEAENTDETVGPYKVGKLGQFDVYCAPSYDPNKWVMACKSNDIRRNSALFGEYMPLTATDPIGLADMSTQAAFATMYTVKIVNPATVVSGKLIGSF